MCNISSINNIKDSNHALCNLGNMTPPSILGNDNRHLLRAALELNTEQNKELVIRQKIIWAHARGSVNIAETSIPTGALPG